MTGSTLYRHKLLPNSRTRTVIGNSSTVWGYFFVPFPGQENISQSQYSSTPAFSGICENCFQCPLCCHEYLKCIFGHINPSCFLTFNYSTLKSKVKKRSLLPKYFTFLVKRDYTGGWIRNGYDTTLLKTSW